MWRALKRTLGLLSNWSLLRFFSLSSPLLGAGVLCDGLGALGNGVLGQLPGKQQTNGSLNFSGGDGGAAVVVSQAGSLGSDALENVVHERVHDRHGLAGDPRVRMNLLQHFVYVDAVTFLPPPLAFLVSRALGLGLAGGFLGSLRRWLGRHDAHCKVTSEMSKKSRDTQYLWQSNALSVKNCNK